MKDKNILNNKVISDFGKNWDSFDQSSLKDTELEIILINISPFFHFKSLTNPKRVLI